VSVLVVGTITGLTYALLAVGLSLIYKSARFVNFAHGNHGAFAAVIFAKLVVDLGVPYWVAFATAVAMGAGLGAVIELGIVRRLFGAPRLVLVVATIAISQLFLFASLQRGLNADQEDLVLNGFPVPFDVSWDVAGVVLHGGEVSILILVPLLALALAAFFRFSSYGQAIRAAAENPDAARLAGISVKRMSTIVWVIAGVLAAVTGLLVGPLRPIFQVGSAGPSILVRALGASLIGGMTNLPIAFGAGIAIGILEAVVFDNFTSGGIQDLAVFVVVMGALIVRARGLARSTRDPAVGFTFGVASRAMPAALASLRAVRRMRSGGVAVALAVAVVLPWLPILDLNTSEKTFLLTLVWGYALVGLSLTVLTGWAGQVSLGQFAMVGVGAFAAARFAGDMPLLLLVIACGMVGVVVAIIVGLPALRIQGLFLAVSTLAFAVVATGWAFQQDFFVVDPAAVSIQRPGIIASERAVYYFGLVLLVLGAIAVRNLRRSGPGRVLIAVRDNDQAARSDGLSAMSTRLLSFALAGFMAAVAGVVFAYARGNFNATSFEPSTSLDMLLMVILGGLGSIPGAILGAVFMFGVPVIFGTGNIADPVNQLVRLGTSAIGVLIVLLFLPGGLISLVHKARDAIAARIARADEGLPTPPPIIPPLRELVRTARGR
jgi:ABC-type branched-subunit amino acid transport system permease subunit